ncbi:MAG: response regulator, partial [Proteobacteria bacterium]|nr:response regulator [Pseudomonadota bacterium]
MQTIESGIFQTDEFFLAYQRVPSTQWLMLAVVPQSVVLGPVFAITIIGALGAGIVLALVVIIFVRRFNQRLQPILHECQALSSQDIDFSGVDELEVLECSFNHMTAQLKSSYETLEAKNAELQRLDQLKDEFLANTSHELRTPLNGIIGIAESLVDGVAGDLTHKVNTNLAMIVSSGRRLSTLINDILDFSKLKHNNMDLQLKPIGLREIVDIVLTLSNPLIHDKPVQLINIISPDLPAAQADENRLQQILYNLIGNSIKFTQHGEIKISAKVVDSNLEIVVSDTGIGIPTKELANIFESFEQAEGSTAREYGGTGLGLAVTKQLIQLHNGKIWVRSTLGIGSQFSFTLPISAEKPNKLLINNVAISKIRTSVETVVEQSVANEPTSTGQIKILIVDDEPINLQVLHNYLDFQNYHIIQASSGQEALTLIEDGLKPDAILLDIMMPKMTGYEVTKKLRNKWQLAELPILLLTAKNQVEDLVVGLEMGANDYLTKPISKDELLARIKTHLSIKSLKEENLRMTAELEVSRRLQQMLLPKDEELEAINNLDISGFMEPADEVGGDYYDVLQHSGRILFAIGDVTGHGLESGALAIMVQSAVRALLADNETDPVKFLSAINEVIYHNVARMNTEKNLTLALLNYQNGELYLSGQHEEIIVVRNGELELIDTIDLGFPIGLDDNITDFIAEAKIPLNKGDVVVLYT